jgi:hypothetical protein
MTISDIVTSGLIISTACAALAWVRSATAKVSAPKDAPSEGYQQIISDDGSMQVSLNGVDLVGTMALQSRWNRVAALCACVAAALQGLQAWLAVSWG